MEEKNILRNSYVREYYNNQVATLESYTEDRWFKTKERKFDYNQTKKTINRALGTRKFNKGIEIGPGDAVWTKNILGHINERLLLIEQSEEMLNQAKNNIGANNKIDFLRADFNNSDIKEASDLVVAIRCFEYFNDQATALKKMYQILNKSGVLIIVTKNSELYTLKNVQNRTLHSGQLSKVQMIKMLEEAGFKVDSVYSATLRWKAKYALSRLFFSFIHSINLLTRGRAVVPFIGRKATESYLFVASKPH